MFVHSLFVLYFYPIRARVFQKTQSISDQVLLLVCSVTIISKISPKKCPFSSAKKRHFERPNLRTDSKNLAKHPQNGWVDIWVMHFHFRASIKPILKNLGRRFHDWKLVFKNWLKTHPKSETHDPNVYTTILGGVSRGFWTPFLDRGARNAIFLNVKTGTFGVFTCQKMALRAPRSKNGVQKPRETPPKMVG